MATSPPITVKVPFKRGTTAQNNAYKGNPGEVTIDSTLRTLVVHDGLKVGGERLLRLADLHDVDDQLTEANAAAAAALASEVASTNSATNSANSASASASSASASADSATSSANSADASAVSAAEALASAVTAAEEVASIGTAVVDSQTAAATATAQAVIAVDKAAIATTKASEAVTSATTATTKATVATDAAAAALISQGNAATSATNAAGSATLAGTRASNALASANTANADAAAAALDAVRAQAWASQDTTPVSAGLYSSKHYAEVAAAIAADISGYARLDGATFTGPVNGITAAMVGLPNVNNTSDVNKPISTATQAALDLKATASVVTSALALKADITYVDSSIAALLDSAPGVLDTLNELAAALGDDPNFATTMTTQLSLKAPINNPAFTGTVTGINSTMVGLGAVNNTADADKPISTLTQTALDTKLNISANTANALLDFANNAGTTTGLTYGYKAGVIRSDNAPVSVAAGTVALTASSTNYIEVTGAGVVSKNIVGFTAGSFPLALVPTGASTITSITDKRSFASVGGGGGSSNTPYVLHKNTVTELMTIPDGFNAIAGGRVSATGSGAIRTEGNASITFV